jgi:RNA polymerase sigma-70 factor (ECF subfamily)
MQVQNQPNENFEDIAFEYMEPLNRKALRLTKSEEDAKDLVQETYLKAWKNFKMYTPGTNFRAWIFTILTNTFINDYRKKSRIPDMIQFEQVEYKVEENDENKESDQIQFSYKNLFEDDVYRALSKISKSNRHLLMLAHIEDFPYKEIAKMYDRPIGTIMSRLFRVKKYLQHILKHYAKRNGYITAN